MRNGNYETLFKLSSFGSRLSDAWNDMVLILRRNERRKAPAADGAVNPRGLEFA